MSRTREQELKAALLAAHLPASDHRLLSVLLSRAQWKTGVIEPQYQPGSLRKLAEWTGLPMTTLRRSLNHTAGHGWLERRYPAPGGGRGRATQYQVVGGRDCDCRPARPEPVPDAERARRYRARKKQGQARVTETGPDVRDERPETTPDVRDSHAKTRDDFPGQGPVCTKSVSDEGEVERAAVKDLALCAVCGTAMDPVLPAAGFATHPCCDPGEVSPLWPPPGGLPVIRAS